MNQNLSDDVTLTRDEFYEQVWTTPTAVLAKSYELSDVGLAKICKKYRIPKPPRGYWAKLTHGQNMLRTPLPSIDREELRQVRISRRADLERRNKGYTGTESNLSGNAANAESISVPERLRSPHPLVKRTGIAFKGNTADSNGIVSLRTKDALDITVGKRSIRRAMLLMDTLIKALEARGCPVSIISEGNRVSTVCKVLNEPIKVELRESVSRKERGPTAKEKKDRERWPLLYSGPLYEYFPSGKLAFYIDEYPGEGLRRVWQDGKKQKLENCLDSFVRGLHIAAEGLKSLRVQREQRQKEWEEEHRRRMEAEERRREEETKVKHLKDLVGNWVESRRIREFLTAVEEAAIQHSRQVNGGSKLGEWLLWARRYADSIDPIVLSFKDAADSC